MGAGAGSIARWLARQVGPDGRVVAIDRDERFLQGPAPPNLEVRLQGAVKEVLDEGTYDLVHCRGLLFHLRSPEEMVAKMARAARPDGWVMVEEADLVTFGPVDEVHPVARAGTLRAMIDFAAKQGIWNPAIGRRLPSMLDRLGLTDIGSEARARIVQGGEPMALFVGRSYQRLDEMCLTGGVIGPAEVAEREQALLDPNFRFLNHLMVAAWGRRPVQPGARSCSMASGWPRRGSAGDW